MRSFVAILLVALASCALACIAAYVVGAFLSVRVAWVRRVGAFAYRKKLALAHGPWPMSAFRRAVRQERVATCALIVSTLIALKSIVVGIAGIASMFLLPFSFASLPALLLQAKSLHPNVPHKWVRHTMILQGSSHIVASALGLALPVAAVRTDQSLRVVFEMNKSWVVGLAVLSLLLAVTAGTVEARGHVRDDSIGVRDTA